MTAPATEAADTQVHEHKGLVTGAAGMLVAGILTTFLSPLVAVSFANDFGFGIEKAGVLIAVGQGFVAIAAFGIAPVINRLDRRRIGLIGAATAAIGLLVTGFVSDSFTAVLLAQAVTGAGAGLAYASANSALSFARLPERAFSIVTIAYMMVGAAMLALGPVLHDVLPLQGLYIGMAVTEALCAIVIMRLPDVRNLAPEAPTIETATIADSASATRNESHSSRMSRLMGPGAFLIASFLLMNVGNLAIWTFAQDMGEASGLSNQGTSTFLGASQLVGLVGAGITLVIGAKVGKLVILIPGIAMLALGNFLVGSTIGVWSFVVGLLVVNVAYFCISPLLFALAAELDPNSGSLVVAVGGVTLVAGALAPALGGFIAGADKDWVTLGIVAAALILVSFPLLLKPVSTASQVSAKPIEVADVV